MRAVQFTLLAHWQYQWWKKTDKKIFARIEKLIDSIKENPFQGVGKPEPLKHELSGH